MQCSDSERVESSLAEDTIVSVILDSCCAATEGVDERLELQFRKDEIRLRRALSPSGNSPCSIFDLGVGHSQRNSGTSISLQWYLQRQYDQQVVAYSGTCRDSMTSKLYHTSVHVYHNK